jgi:hypothetical protein
MYMGLHETTWPSVLVHISFSTTTAPELLASPKPTDAAQTSLSEVFLQSGALDITDRNNRL